MQNRLCSTNKKCQTSATVLIAVPDLKRFPILKNGQILTNGSKINMARGCPKKNLADFRKFYILFPDKRI